MLELTGQGLLGLLAKLCIQWVDIISFCPLMLRIEDFTECESGIGVPYLAKTRGSVPEASRIRMGVCGLCFFMVG